MCASSKKEILQLPLKVILTEEGVSQFIRQKKRLLRFKLADNVEEWDTTVHYLDFHVRNNYLVQLFPLIKHCELDDIQAERVSEIIERYNKKVSELECKLRELKKLHKQMEEVIQ